DDDAPRDEVLIIPADLIKRIPKPSVGDYVTIEAQGNQVSAISGGVTIGGQAIDGNYPNWRNVVPKGPTGHPTRINIYPCFLKDLIAAGKAITGRDEAVVMEQSLFNQEGSGDWATPLIIRFASIPNFLG